MVAVLHIVAFNIQRRSKHDIFKSRYQLGEFHHLHNEPRKNPTEWLEYCNLLPSAVHYVVQAIRQHISLRSAGYTTAHFITQCRLYDRTFHYVLQAIRQHISLRSAGYTTAHFITQCRLYDSTFHYVVQAIRQHISLRSAGYTTAHFIT